jgi:recombination protein RecA
MSNKLEAFFKSFAETDAQLDFRLAHETIGEKVSVVSTGSLSLDDALSSGGLPNGRLIQYYGPPSSGKTLLAMLAIKEAQHMDPTAQQMFIDAEGTFDPSWASALGCDISRIIVVDGETAVIGRSCFEMILGVPKEDKKTHEYIGKSKEGLLDNIKNGQFNINIIVLDSLGAIIPPGEDISVIGKMNMALLSRFLTTTFRKLSLELNRAGVPFIVINHKKANMDPYGVDHAFSGGNAYAHFLSANVYFEAVSRADAQILDEKDQKIGHTIRATVEKSKFGATPRKCEFKVNFSIGVIDKHEEIAKLAIDYNVISKPSQVSYEYGDKKWVGLGKFQDAVKDDLVLADELVLKINEARENKRSAQKAEQESLRAAVLSRASETEEKKKKVAKINV